MLIDDPRNVVLVHYLGNENVAVDFPHRNAIKFKSNFVRTLPSYLKSCEKKVAVEKASVVYKKEVAQIKNSESMPITLPRNMQQMRNLRFKQIKEKRISSDAIYNLHELAYSVPGFVRKIVTYPNLICVCGLEEIVEEMNRILLLNENGQLLSYDTTFQMGDFYVSSLIFRHLLFEQQPCIPVLFLIHERKFTETHKELFHLSGELIPLMKKLSLPLATDREKAIVTAIKHELPNINLVHCWNHLMRNVEKWCISNDKDVVLHSNHVQCLIEADDENAYAEMLSNFRSKWDPEFEDYYMNHIDTDILSIGRWNLEKLNIYHPYSGVTTNQSEALNR